MSHKNSPSPPPETVYVATRRVACDGPGGALGHPRVWYSLSDGEAECGYCDRRFIYDPARAPGAKVDTGFARKGAPE
jgi:uncharacterized Zn-finger protein